MTSETARRDLLKRAVPFIETVSDIYDDFIGEAWTEGDSKKITMLNRRYEATRTLLSRIDTGAHPSATLLQVALRYVDLAGELAAIECARLRVPTHVLLRLVHVRLSAEQLADNIKEALA